jgi:hypothetical protein
MGEMLITVKAGNLQALKVVRQTIFRIIDSDYSTLGCEGRSTARFLFTTNVL